MVSHRRTAVASRVAGALCIVAALVAGPAMAVPSLTGACASAGGGSVAVVVDFGGLPGGRNDVVVRCVAPGSPKSTGAQALADAGFSVRYDPSSGLLCGIDGYPSSGCGDRQGGGRQYKYWAYWRKGAGDPVAWTYASIGPASARVQAGDVEGWRYVEGAGSPSDPAPRMAPDQAALCGVSPPAPPAPPPGGPGPAPSGGGGSGGAAPSVASPPTAPAGEAPPATDAGAGTDPATPTDTPVPPDASVLGVSVDGAAPDGGGDGSDGASELAATPAGEPTGGPPWPAIALAAVIVVLGAGAFVKFRATTPEP